MAKSNAVRNVAVDKNQAANDKNYNNVVSSSAARIKKTDRSDVSRTGQNIVRNVRTSSMPGNTEKNRVGSMRSTTDEQFAASYNIAGSTKQNNDPQSNIQTEKFSSSRNTQVQYNPIPTQPQSQKINTLRRRKKNKLFKARKLRKKISITSLNIWIIGVGTSLWLFIQLPFAILGLLGFGAAVGLESLSRTQTDDGLLIKGVKFLYNSIADIATFLANLVNFDVSYLDPSLLYVFSYTLIALLAIFKLLAIILLYKLIFIQPFGGKSSSSKIGAFLLVLIGYLTPLPLLQLFPWFLVYVAVVWMKIIK